MDWLTLILVQQTQSHRSGHRGFQLFSHLREFNSILAGWPPTYFSSKSGLCQAPWASLYLAKALGALIDLLYRHVEGGLHYSSFNNGKVTLHLALISLR